MNYARPKYFPEQYVIASFSDYLVTLNKDESKADVIIKLPETITIFAKIVGGEYNDEFAGGWVYRIELCPGYWRMDVKPQGKVLTEILEQDIMGPANPKDELEFWIPQS